MHAEYAVFPFQMDLNEMAESWMTSYLSREMMLPDVLRLWGEPYFVFQS